MTTPIGKTFFPTAVKVIRIACDFVTKHGARLIEVAQEVSPDNAAGIETGITAIQAACAVFEAVYKIVDPNA